MSSSFLNSYKIILLFIASLNITNINTEYNTK